MDQVVEPATADRLNLDNDNEEVCRSLFDWLTFPIHYSILTRVQEEQNEATEAFRDQMGPSAGDAPLLILHHVGLAFVMSHSDRDTSWSICYVIYQGFIPVTVYLLELVYL